MSVLQFPPSAEPEAIDPSRLLAENTDLAIQLSCTASWANSLLLRLESFQVRRLRWLTVGVAVGALLAWIADGDLAQITDRVLRAVGV